MEKDLLTEILERVVRVETKIDGYNNSREKLDTTNALSMSNEREIREIKDNQRWIWRTIAGIVITYLATSIMGGI